MFSMCCGLKQSCFKERHPTSYCVYAQVGQVASTEKCSTTLNKKRLSVCEVVGNSKRQGEENDEIIF